MKILARAWQEFWHGENIDIYIGVPLAAVIAFLGIRQQVSAEMVSAATLAVLAVVLGSLLGNRWNTESVKNAIASMAKDKCSADDFFEDFNRKDLSSLIKESKTILLWSVTFTSTIRDLHHEIEEALSKGATVRVMLIRPDSPTSEVASHRNRQWDNKRVSEAIYQSLRFLHDFSILHPKGKLEVRLSDSIPPWGMIAVYPEKLPGRMMIRINTVPIPRAQRPAFVVDARRDPKWFVSFERQFYETWESAQNVSLDGDFRLDETG